MQSCFASCVLRSSRRRPRCGGGRGGAPLACEFLVSVARVYTTCVDLLCLVPSFMGWASEDPTMRYPHRLYTNSICLPAERVLQFVANSYRISRVINSCDIKQANIHYSNDLTFEFRSDFVCEKIFDRRPPAPLLPPWSLRRRPRPRRHGRRGRQE